MSEIKAGSVVAVSGAWVDLMTVASIDGDKVTFTSGDYVDLSKVRLADPEELIAECKLF